MQAPCRSCSFAEARHRSGSGHQRRRYAGETGENPRGTSGPDRDRFGGSGRFEAKLPRLGLDVAVFHGVDEDILRRAVGHVPGTALPGQGENVGLAGHRDTFFRSLRDVREGDLVILETPHDQRHYRVAETSVVEADAVEVLAPTGTETLTLVTCYPFRWVDPAPRRCVVRAEAVTPGI